jgi:hypothetical protein
MTPVEDQAIMLQFVSTPTEREVLEDWLRRTRPEEERVNVLAGDSEGLAAALAGDGGRPEGDAGQGGVAAARARRCTRRTLERPPGLQAPTPAARGGAAADPS